MLICYESIFPEIAGASVIQGANLLVNITNDAWYGRSSAPYQSMAMAVFRAVENKRALVRSANTGISGFIDPLGNITEQTEIFTEAARVAQVPLFDLQTVFNRKGSHFGLACAVFIPLLLVFRRRSDRG
jgi:apolipoprotein N-acyltransferase